MNNNSNAPVVTRFAPSPTGLLHGGNYRTAIFAYLFARKHSGKFIVRIEDTDKERSKKEYEANILESLAWLGLEYDELHHQSERVDRHEIALKKLVEEGKAYISKEEAKDGSGVIKEIVRFKNPNKKVAFEDAIRGRIETDTTDLGDFVIAKNIREPLFHLAVVVDDAEMGVTHIIRGEDHIPNTPRHILLQEALGFPTPIYAHLPLVLSPDRSKLSKRKGALALTEYRDRGYLPEAMLNFMTLIGWNPGTEQEIFSKEELVQVFDLAQVQKAAAVFNEEKLNWFNREYLKKLPIETLQKEIVSVFGPLDATLLSSITPLILDRIVTLGDIQIIKEVGEFDFFFKAPDYTKELLKTPEFLKATLEKLAGIPSEAWNMEEIKTALWDYATEVGRGKVLWPLRVALTGKEKSPDPFTVASILGKEEAVRRITHAISLS